MKKILFFLLTVCTCSYAFGDENSYDPLKNRIPTHDKRYHTMKRALELMVERNLTTIVETGTARGGEGNFIGDGGSTVIFGDWASHFGAMLYSVDIDPHAIEVAKAATIPYHSHIQFFCMDSVEMLKNFPKKIDFLYLDSFDYDYNNPIPSQKHHLKEIQAAYNKLTPKSVVMIDDCDLPGEGKGKEVITFLLQRKWMIIENGYQVILIRNL